MTIKEIAAKINSYVEEGAHLFSNLQSIRRKYGQNPTSLKPFQGQGIKKDYAFHSGGRKELQFNFGNEFIRDRKVFRYGVAFSLEINITVPDPKTVFQSKIEAFNLFLSRNPKFFDGFKMWYFNNRNFEQIFNEVQLINDEMFKPKNFIFIGKYFNKSLDNITEYDLKKILQTFDYLIPLYEAVQFYGIEPLKLVNEKRIARLCWNENGWIKPSGRNGKSNNKNTHEGEFGYGHEEWLFDISKLIDNYHYGFLEPIDKQRNAFKNRIFDVWLYTIDGISKKRLWVAEIKNLEVIDIKTSNSIVLEYQKRGWWQEMYNQLKLFEVDPSKFKMEKGKNLFNVKYLISDLKVHETMIEIPSHSSVYKQDRYNFGLYRDEYNQIINNDLVLNFQPPSSQNEDKGNLLESQTYVRELKTIEISYLHKLISNGLTKELEKKYGKYNVRQEHPTCYGANRVDIVVNHDNEMIFYEIKTYLNLKNSIREAIGQLMEYSLWTNKQNAKKLIVVTQPIGDFEKARVYFKHLRDLFNLPIYYQYYDFENNVLSELV